MNLGSTADLILDAGYLTLIDADEHGAGTMERGGINCQVLLHKPRCW